MNKNVMFGLGAVVVATLGFVLFGMNDPTDGGVDENAGVATAKADGADKAGAADKAAHVVRKDDERAEAHGRR